MQPIFYKRMLACAAFGLGYFIFVMRENQITAAAMEIKTFAQIFHAHNGALNMPARSAFSPRAGPGRFAWFSCLPKSEIHRIFLTFINVNTGTGQHIIQITSA